MNWTIDLTQIIIALLGILATVITAKVIPWIQSKTSVEQQQFIKLVLDAGVRAAEQIYTSGEGQLKKAYVIDYLKEHHITIDDAQIEAAVNEFFGKDKIYREG